MPQDLPRQMRTMWRRTCHPTPRPRIHQPPPQIPSRLRRLQLRYPGGQCLDGHHQRGDERVIAKACALASSDTDVMKFPLASTAKLAPLTLLPERSASGVPDHTATVRRTLPVF